MKISQIEVTLRGDLGILCMFREAGDSMILIITLQGVRVVMTIKCDNL